MQIRSCMFCTKSQRSHLSAGPGGGEVLILQPDKAHGAPTASRERPMFRWAAGGGIAPYVHSEI